MKVLSCDLVRSDIWSAPIYWLTPIHKVNPEKTNPPDLFDDPDENGMRHPLICWPLSFADWHRWCRDRPHVTGSLTPVAWGGTRDGAIQHVYKRGLPDQMARTLAEQGLIWAVHTGSQRLLWAQSRGYSQVPAVLCTSYQACDKWRDTWYGRA